MNNVKHFLYFVTSRKQNIFFNLRVYFSNLIRFFKILLQQSNDSINLNLLVNNLPMQIFSTGFLSPLIRQKSRKKSYNVAFYSSRKFFLRSESFFFPVQACIPPNRSFPICVCFMPKTANTFVVDNADDVTSSNNTLQ